MPGFIAFAALLAPGLAHAQIAPGDLREAVNRGSRGDRELAGFYARRDWQPLWVERQTVLPAAATLLDLVDHADADGLSPQALNVPDLAAAVRKAQRERSPRSLARAEVALSRTFAAYVRAMRRPRASGMTYHSSLLQPVVPSASAALAAAAEAPSLTRYLEHVEWMHPIYGALRDALVHSTLDRSRQEQVFLNLERARALPASPAQRYVLIDAAGARLWMYENGQPVDSMKVVVGKPDLQTPMVAGLITQAVLNPYWNVPVDLVQTRIAGSVLDQGLSYLRTGGYQVLSDFGDKPSLLDPARIDWRAVADGQRELRVRQLPGKANFMGQIKFNFANPDGIYLHDTPDKALLNKDVRTASSG
ncbi:MAG: L,D-transpeptidase family protein, partial [Novosphingobium sp.]